MIHNPARKQLPALSNPGAASDLRSGKQLVGADGSVITGTLAEVTQATPQISVSSGGLITVSATQSGGIVTAGSKSTTQQLTTQGADTITPSATAKTAVAAGRYTTGAVQVAGDSNLIAANIVKGKRIFGVSGTAEAKTTAIGTITRRSYSFNLYYVTGTSYGFITSDDAPIEISSYTNTFIMVSISSTAGASPKTTGLKIAQIVQTYTGYIYLYLITSATFSFAV